MNPEPRRAFVKSMKPKLKNSPGFAKELQQAKMVLDRAERNLRESRKVYVGFKEQYGGLFALEVVIAEAQYRRARVERREAGARFRTMMAKKKGDYRSRP